MVRQHDVDRFYWRGKRISEIDDPQRLRRIIVEVAQRASATADKHGAEMFAIGVRPSRKPRDPPNLGVQVSTPLPR